ncbi:MAG: TonB-dependent receptor [Deltaproteobacteria bacterium]|nr:TonB-dependent receptor [Deltaproteobacteria bacterium]
MRQKHLKRSTFMSQFSHFTLLVLFATLFILGSMRLSVCAEPNQKTGEGEAYEDYILEDTVVTATKRETRLIDVAQSISAFSSEDLEDMGAGSFQDIVDAIVGVELRNNQAGLGSITIRGVSDGGSSMDGRQGGTGSAVGFYLDEMPLTMAAVLPDVKSFDMARIEVLRGPQGTLYGEGSMAGTVRLVSEKPDSKEFAAKTDLTYSSTKEGGSNYIANAMVNIPLAEDKLALRLVGYYNDQSGYIDYLDYLTGNLVEKDANEDENIGLRAALRFTPQDELVISATVLLADASRGPLNDATKDFTYRASIDTSTEDDLLGYNLTVNYAFPFADLVSSTSYFDREHTGNLDISDLLPSVNGLFGSFGIPLVGGLYMDEIVESKAFSQEIRLVSTGDGPFKWNVGAFYKKQDNDWSFEGKSVPETPESTWLFVSGFLFDMYGIPHPPIGNSIFTGTEGSVEQYAGFSEISYDFNDHFQLLAGARFFTEERDTTSNIGGLFPFLTAGFLPGSYSSTGDDNVFNPKVTASYKFNDDAMAYATFSRGFRSGGQNDFFAIVPGAVLTYDSETLDNYEVGLKSYWLDKRLSFNIAGYYMKWKDLQIVTIRPPSGGVAIDNVGDAHSSGVEFEIRARLLKGLDLSVSSSFSETELDDTLTRQPFPGSPGVIPDGTRIPGTTDFKFHCAAQYWRYVTDKIAGFARLSYSHTGDSIIWEIHDDGSTLPSYDIVNARLGIETDRWSISVFADNLFDEFIIHRYAERLPTATDPATSYVIGRPRTIGLNLRFNF